MADLSDKYTKILADIESHISNPNERKYVERKIMELSAIYLEILNQLTKVNSMKISKIGENQAKIVEKVAKVQETIDFIKNDIYENEGYEFEITCPYCNFEFITEIDEGQKKELKCPECDNIIELDWEEEKDKNAVNNHQNKMNNAEKKDEDDEF